MLRQTPANPFIERDELLTAIFDEFVAYGQAHGQDYRTLRRNLRTALEHPSEEIAERQRKALPSACAYQILLELGWLAKYCTDWNIAQQRLVELEAAMANYDHDQINPVQVEDGSWGGCYREWYRKLEPTVDALQQAVEDDDLIALAFMARLQDAKATIDRLWQLQISDIRITGRNNRDELGAMQTALSQLIFKDNLRDLLNERPQLGFAVSDELETDYGDFLRQTQHPRTGFWGPWYRINGQLFQVQDLSFTFHTVNYRQGNVENWPLIIDTTLGIQGFTYPMGWTPTNGADYSHHNNYDVVTIFMYGWTHMSRKKKDEVRDKIVELLTWCLGPALGENGFKPEAGTAPADTYYYGVRFLDRLGFWDSSRRFWSRRPPTLPAGIASPGALAQRLCTAFEALGDFSQESKTVRAILNAALRLSDLPVPDDAG